ncbi:hypothetical protein BH10BDE1_BH10BDE1_10970 [soil metagenome]
MKTSVRLAFVLLVSYAMSLAALAPAFAETDQEFETAMVQRQRDFNSYIKDRNSEKKDILKAAEVLHEARKAAEMELAENQRNYLKKMKRYSMEEIEVQDREDDVRLERERAQADATRALYAESRDRRRSIEASIGPLDSYQEFDINMSVEPETKVSHPGSSMSSTPGSGGDAL